MLLRYEMHLNVSNSALSIISAMGTGAGTENSCIDASIVSRSAPRTDIAPREGGC